jgi:prepilin-type N-terminal cleavage/methylation domain-containing protein
MMSRRGFTLIEVLIASFIGLLVLGGVLALFSATAKDVDRAEASYGLEDLLVTAIKPLQTDLRYTTLASVASYPQDNSSTSGQGVSLVSADPLGEMGKLQISRFGTPAWQKHVFYTLVSDTSKTGESHLVRYEQALPKGDFVLVSSHLPYDLPTTNTERIIAKQVLKSGYSLKPKAGGDVTLAQDKSSKGGFQVQFLQTDGTTTSVNPTANDDPTKTTGVLVVNLTLIETSDLGKVSALPFEFRVAPRN